MEGNKQPNKWSMLKWCIIKRHKFDNSKGLWRIIKKVYSKYETITSKKTLTVRILKNGEVFTNRMCKQEW